MQYKKTPKDVIFGVRAVLEAIEAGREINKILIKKGIENDLFKELKAALSGKNFTLQYVPVEKINSITAENHQGVIAYVAPVEYMDLEPYVEQAQAAGKTLKILALDRITDVRNFGGIARTAECMGVDLILLPKTGSVTVTADAVKTSAGALNRIPVARVEDFKNSLFFLQQSDFKIFSFTEKGNVPLYEANMRGNVLLLFGSEENGITSDLLNMSDLKIKIPMKGRVASLNVGVTVGMVLYEMVRREQQG